MLQWASAQLIAVVRPLPLSKARWSRLLWEELRVQSDSRVVRRPQLMCGVRQHVKAEMQMFNFILLYTVYGNMVAGGILVDSLPTGIVFFVAMVLLEGSIAARMRLTTWKTTLIQSLVINSITTSIGAVAWSRNMFSTTNDTSNPDFGAPILFFFVSWMASIVIEGLLLMIANRNEMLLAWLVAVLANTAASFLSVIALFAFILLMNFIR
jgi:hypothetical protein